MKTLELYLVNHEKKTLSRFAIVDNMPGLLDILQILADTRDNGLENVIGRDPENGNCYNVAAIAAHYGMRRRSFDERLQNVKTYTLPAAAEV